MRETQDCTWPGAGAALLSFAPGPGTRCFFPLADRGTALLCGSTCRQYFLPALVAVRTTARCASAQQRQYWQQREHEEEENLQGRINRSAAMPVSNNIWRPAGATVCLSGESLTQAPRRYRYKHQLRIPAPVLQRPVLAFRSFQSRHSQSQSASAGRASALISP